MKREILINGTPRETRVAILEDDRLVELLVDRPDHRRMVGDIYLGRVEAVLPGIQAAFVDIGLEKSAFLHASDLLEPDDEHDPDDEPEDVADGSDEGPAPGVGEADVPRASRRRRRRGRGNASSNATPVEGGEAAGDAGAPGTDGFDDGPGDDDVGDDGPEGESLPEGGTAGEAGAESGPGEPRRGRRGRRRGRRRGKGGDRGQGNGQGQIQGEPSPLVPVDQIAGFLPRMSDSAEPAVEPPTAADDGQDASQRPRAPEPDRQRQPRRSKQNQKQERKEKARQQQQQREPQAPKGGREPSPRPSVPAPQRQREVESLLGLWKKINKKTRFVRAPALVQRETSLTRGIIRDLFSAKVDSLSCDSKELHHEIAQYLEQIDPDLMGRVKLWQESQPLFEKFDIEREIRDLFKARCDLPTGGYIIIQPTEALV